MKLSELIEQLKKDDEADQAQLSQAIRYNYHNIANHYQERCNMRDEIVTKLKRVTEL